MPRTGATKLHMNLQQGIYRNTKSYVPYYGEYLKELSGANKVEKLQLLLEQNNHDVIVKLFPTDLYADLTDKIEWDRFDCIWLTRRQNLADQLISQVIARMSNQWIKINNYPWSDFSTSVRISDSDIDLFIHQIDIRTDVEKQIKQRVSPSKIQFFYYEDIVEDNIIGEYSTVPTNYDYQRLCTNYDYVKEQIEKKSKQ